MKTIISACCIFLASLVSGQETPTPQVVVDGYDREWEKPLKYSDTKSDILYSFADDSLNFYICIQAISEENQYRIMRSGLRIQFSPSKKGGIALQYPLAVMNRNPPQEKKDIGEELKKMRKTFTEDHQLVRLEGFSTGSATRKLSEVAEISVAAGWDSSGVMTLEYAIPLRELLLLTKDQDKAQLWVNFTFFPASDLQPDKRGFKPDIGFSTSVGTGFGSGIGTGVGFGTGPGYNSLQPVNRAATTSSFRHRIYFKTNRYSHP